MEQKELSLKDKVEYVVSAINNYLEEKQYRYKDMFVKDIVGEMGVGYVENDYSSIYRIVGDNIELVEYDTISLYEMLKNGVSEVVVNKALDI